MPYTKNYEILFIMMNIYTIHIYLYVNGSIILKIIKKSKFVKKTVTRIKGHNYKITFLIIFHQKKRSSRKAWLLSFDQDFGYSFPFFLFPEKRREENENELQKSWYKTCLSVWSKRIMIDTNIINFRIH